MSRHLLRPLGLALLGLLALVGPVLAGGWAVTTLDALPEDGFRTGETYRVGYMIRQHGQTPYPGARTEIIIRSSAGEASRFPGVAEGTVGHYVAEVTFPAAGDWSWEVTQGPFEPQKLGSLRVQAPAVTPVADQTPDLTLLRLALVAGTLSLLSLFAWRLARSARRSSAAAPLGDPL